MKTIYALLLLFISGYTSQSPAQSLNTLPRKEEGFLWGVASSAFQVEGFPQPSDWTRWTQQKNRIADGSNANQAAEFWTRYKEDLSLARRMGSNAFRISIAWERIQPAKNQWDEAALNHYAQIITAMRVQGLEPIITLHHFVLPAWLADEGGLLAPEFPQLFATYAEHVVRRLGRSPCKVKYWMTFNEPMVLANMAYVTGEWPPGHKNDASSAMKAAAAMAKAHIESVRKIRALPDGSELLISIAKHWRLFEGEGLWPFSTLVARFSDWVFNRQMINALTTGHLLFWMPGSTLVQETVALPQNKTTLDYLGLNYYGRSIVGLKATPPFFTTRFGNQEKNDLGWELYPEGLGIALKETERYGLPVLISENGVADATDQLRPSFLLEHLKSLSEARAQGQKIWGYLHWSLTDNFEWAYGLTPRFGLVEIDYKTQRRSPRASYNVYKRLIR